jgi:hypothetical protein
VYEALGISVNKGLGRRRPTQVRRRLGPQVLYLLRRGGSPQYLVAVWVATEAPYHVAGGLGLEDPELGPRLELRRGVGRLLLFVEDDALVEGEVVFRG